MDWLNPDGELDDQERAQTRYHVGQAGIRRYVTPERLSDPGGPCHPGTRAGQAGCPRRLHPEDDAPVIDDFPAEDAVRRDTRTQAQRNHDALLAALRALLASGKLGQHNGIPVTLVVILRLQDLEAATGKALTGGGSLLPMSDVIRLAGHAHHYLALFDGAKPLALYHTKRLASPAQRIMLYARDCDNCAP
jgi:hypothetical protein